MRMLAGGPGPRRGGPSWGRRPGGGPSSAPPPGPMKGGPRPACSSGMPGGRPISWGGRARPVGEEKKVGTDLTLTIVKYFTPHC